MAERRRYTKRERVAAIMAADMTSVPAAAAATGIPERTLYRWRDDPAMAEYVTKTREALADDIRITAALAWDRLTQRIAAGDIETRDLIVAAGVAVDKSQLLSGGATARTEARDITGTLSDADLIAALRTADALAGGSGTAEAPAGAPEGD
jgi:hypothetical protein